MLLGLSSLKMIVIIKNEKKLASIQCEKVLGHGALQNASLVFNLFTCQYFNHVLGILDKHYI